MQVQATPRPARKIKIQSWRQEEKFRDHLLLKLNGFWPKFWIATRRRNIVPRSVPKTPTVLQNQHQHQPQPQIQSLLHLRDGPIFLFLLAVLATVTVTVHYLENDRPMRLALEQKRRDCCLRRLLMQLLPLY